MTGTMLDNLPLGKLSALGIDPATAKALLADAAWSWFNANKGHVIWEPHFGFFTLHITTGMARPIIEAIFGPEPSVSAVTLTP